MNQDNSIDLLLYSSWRSEGITVVLEADHERELLYFLPLCHWVALYYIFNLKKAETVSFKWTVGPLCLVWITAIVAELSRENVFLLKEQLFPPPLEWLPPIQDCCRRCCCCTLLYLFCHSKILRAVNMVPCRSTKRDGFVFKRFLKIRK